MKRLVDDLLDVSRITSGRIQLQKSQVDAAEIITRVAEANDVLFSSRGHTLHLETPREETSLEADPYRLEQILSNLLVNAAKYTDAGGEIWFSAKREGPDVVFRVRDSGIGIGPDLLPNVFDLFAQANRSLHRAEGGLADTAQRALPGSGRPSTTARNRRSASGRSLQTRPPIVRLPSSLTFRPWMTQSVEIQMVVGACGLLTSMAAMVWPKSEAE